jgi:hypothetical protein
MAFENGETAERGNKLARFYAPGAKTRHGKIPFVSTRKIETANSAVKLNE